MGHGEVSNWGEELEVSQSNDSSLSLNPSSLLRTSQPCLSRHIMQGRPKRRRKLE